MRVGIIILSTFVIIDLLVIEYRCADLTGLDAAEMLLRASYSLNYTMQRVSTLSGILLWMLILRMLKFVPQLFGARLDLFSQVGPPPRGWGAGGGGDAPAEWRG